MVEKRLSRNWWVVRLSHGDKDRKSTRLNSSHSQISYAVFCLQKKIFYIFPGLRIAFIPVRRRRIVGDHNPGQRNGPIHARQVRAIELVPLIADLLIVAEFERR